MYLVTYRDATDYTFNVMIKPAIPLGDHMKKYYPDCTYTYIEVSWPAPPPPPKPKILRPEWTRQIGATWLHPEYNNICTLVTETHKMIFDRGAFERAGRLLMYKTTVQSDENDYWLDIIKLPQES